MRVAILGDASGWLGPTLGALRRLGVGSDLGRFSWPDDPRVVQVGDLVHSGESPSATAAATARRGRHG